MNTGIGVWIDHRRAVIALASDEDGKVTEILSRADRQPGREDGIRSGEKHEPQRVQADDVQDRKFEQALNHFYDEVIALVHEARSLLIFGPGEAKGEFRKRLVHGKPGSRDVTVETADKMTDRQVAAKVRHFFQAEHPRADSTQY